MITKFQIIILLLIMFLYNIWYITFIVLKSHKKLLTDTGYFVKNVTFTRM